MTKWTEIRLPVDVALMIAVLRLRFEQAFISCMSKYNIQHPSYNRNDNRVEIVDVVKQLLQMEAAGIESVQGRGYGRRGGGYQNGGYGWFFLSFRLHLD